MSGVDVTVLTNVDEGDAPPSQPVLIVSVVEDVPGRGDVVSLSIAKYSETHRTMHYEVIEEVSVDRDALLHALEDSR